jgi:hypothetical protein
MTQAYLYRWTELSTGKWYVGSRTAKNCHPDDGYICSSKYVKPLIKNNPTDWTREILVISDKKYIRDLEVKYLKSLQAVKDKQSYNKHYGGATFANSGEFLSDETKNKISASLTGSKHPLYGKPCSEERRQAIIKGTLGVKKTTTEKMRKPKRKEQCPHCGIFASGGNLAKWHLDKCKEYDNVLV